MDEKTGEYGERQLNHSSGEAEKFYRELQHHGVHARVGMEATGNALWFERLLAELGFELWIGDPAEIKTKRVRKKRQSSNTSKPVPMNSETHSRQGKLVLFPCDSWTFFPAPQLP